MKMRICLAVVLAVALLVGGFSGSALALCEKTVKIIRVSTDETDTHYIYGQDLFHVLPGYVWVWSIDNDDLGLLNAAQAAYVSGAPAKIVGDAESCPTGGEGREGGKVLNIYLTGK